MQRRANLSAQAGTLWQNVCLPEAITIHYIHLVISASSNKMLNKFMHSIWHPPAEKVSVAVDSCTLSICKFKSEPEGEI